MGKRAIIYARVSTDEQAERGFSLPSQVEACRKYAELQGFEIVGEPFRDDFTGSKLSRPALAKARALIDSAAVDALIVLSSDRLTRSMAHSVLLREQLKSRGVELHYVHGGKQDETPETRMSGNIQGAFNEYWREKIVEATRRGLRSKAQRGLVVGMGGAPYGYRFADKQLIIHEPEACIVRLIYTWYVIGDEQGNKLSAWLIAKRLANDRVPTPSESNNKRRRTRPPCAWNPHTVGSILRNETYAGVWHFGKRQSEARGEPLIKVAVLCIVSRATWQAARDRAGVNEANVPKHVRREYLLRGRLFCGRCGRRMRGVFNNAAGPKGVTYYVCSSRYDRPGGVGDGACQCDQPGMRSEPADQIAWNYVRGVLVDDDFEEKLHDAQRREQAQVKPKQDRAAAISARLAELDQEATRVSAMSRRVEPGSRMANRLAEEANEIDREHAKLECERDELLTSVARETISDAQMGVLLQMRREAQTGVANATYEDQLRILDVLQVTALATGYHLKVTCRFETGDTSNLFALSSPTITHSKAIELSATFDLSMHHGYPKRGTRAPK